MLRLTVAAMTVTLGVSIAHYCVRLAERSVEVWELEGHDHRRAV
jgi:hypothetical protein